MNTVWSRLLPLADACASVVGKRDNYLAVTFICTRYDSYWEPNFCLLFLSASLFLFLTFRVCYTCDNNVAKAIISSKNLKIGLSSLTSLAMRVTMMSLKTNSTLWKMRWK